MGARTVRPRVALSISNIYILKYGGPPVDGGQGGRYTTDGHTCLRYGGREDTDGAPTGRQVKVYQHTKVGPTPDGWYTQRTQRQCMQAR